MEVEGEQRQMARKNRKIETTEQGPGRSQPGGQAQSQSADREIPDQKQNHRTARRKDRTQADRPDRRKKETQGTRPKDGKQTPGAR